MGGGGVLTGEVPLHPRGLCLARGQRFVDVYVHVVQLSEDNNRKAASHGDTSLTRKYPPVGPYSGTMPRAIPWSKGGGQFVMSEVTLSSWSTCTPRAWPTHTSHQFEFPWVLRP